MTDRIQHVIVGMSGGVDSSVSAALLRERGYSITGVHLRMPVFGDRDGDGREEAARTVAEHLSIPLRVVDVREEFEREIIDDFVRAYAAGRTPNPCVHCNDRIKFRHLLRQAREEEADRVATGHYVATVRVRDTGRTALSVGHNGNEQSYFLSALSQESLQRAVFPLSRFQKAEVRRMARSRQIPVHDRPDSQDLCFLTNARYTELLRERCPEAFRPGPIVHVSGARLGEHEGIAAYTPGQRRGLGVAYSEPLYVVEVRPNENTVVVGEKEHVYRDSITVGEVNWMACPGPPSEPLTAKVKIRYNHPGAPATVRTIAEGRVRVDFEEEQEAPAPGQAAVFYRDGVVLGGGTIEQTRSR
ncbi:MAG: tRNA 2-thiouridine(34) synthase MnmA [Candidatus Brocadiia bacterium]